MKAAGTESPLVRPAGIDVGAEAHRASESVGAYRQILKSSALIGASSLFNIFFGIIRTKAMALLLGPSSFGLMGAYGSIVDLSRTLAQMGVNASGVRQIAQSAATGDDTRTAATSQTLKRVAFATASLGALALLASSKYVAQFTFGSTSQWGDIALLSLAVFFGVLAGGQTALIQGMRRIADLSQLAMIGTFLGTIASIALVYFLRENGLALSLIVGAAISALAGWWYSRRIALPRVTASFGGSANEAAEFFKLGAAFMAGDLLTQGAAYIVRIIILRDSGLAAAGLYQAAWTLGGLYVGFVLQAMATDFYPRLAATIQDKDEANLLVNQQASVSMLLAGPGVVGTLTFAPIVVHLLYSARFDGASEILRWVCFGMALKAITWPMGFIVAASGRQMILLAAELAWTVVNVLLTWVCVARMGPVGAGFAFFASYIFHAVMLYPLVRHLTGFRWTTSNLQLGMVYVVSCSVVIAASYALAPGLATVIGIVVCSLLTLQGALRLAQMSAAGPLPSPVLKLMKYTRWIRHPIRGDGVV